MKRIFLSLAGFVTLFGLVAAPVQSTPMIPTYHFEIEPSPKTETFFGTVLKDGENFVLSDSATKTRYVLDSPQKAGRYTGMTVKVTGTLDVASSVIHVENIQQIV